MKSGPGCRAADYRFICPAVGSGPSAPPPRVAAGDDSSQAISPPQAVVHVREESLGVVAPVVVVVGRDAFGEHLRGALALDRQPLDALADRGQHLVLSFEMRAALGRTALRDDQGSIVRH